MNTAALEFVDTSRVPIESGDLVMVIDDRAKVMQLQAGHGEWVDSMGQVSTTARYTYKCMFCSLLVLCLLTCLSK